MSDWKNYSLIKKLLIGIAITLIALVSPELMIIMDFGGIELALSFLLLYFKPFIVWLEKQIQSITNILRLIKLTFERSSLIQQNVFLAHFTTSLLIMILSSSILISMSTILPALYLGGV